MIIYIITDLRNIIIFLNIKMLKEDKILIEQLKISSSCHRKFFYILLELIRKDAKY